MGRLELAEKRLAKALEALERAAKDVQAGAKTALQDSEHERLIQERDHLLARIARLEDELAALSSTSQEVEGRLDGAISEIRAALAR